MMSSLNFVYCFWWTVTLLSVTSVFGAIRNECVANLNCVNTQQSSSPKQNRLESCRTFGLCSQQCDVVEGIVKCSCSSEFKMESDNQTCSAKDPNWKLLYITDVVVGMRSGRKRSHTIKFDGSGDFNAVTYDVRKKKTCWTSASPSLPSVYCSIGDTLEIIANSGVGHPEGIAIDWITENVYFVDSELNKILVCGKNIDACSVLVTEHANSPRHIALDPNHGFMFWTNLEGNSRIMRADMDGENSLPILLSELKVINGLAVDQANSRLYWIDSKFDKLESCLLNGSDRRTILSRKRLFINAPLIDIFENRAFWANLNTDTIFSMEKFTGTNVTAHYKNQAYGKLRQGKIFHLANQPISLVNPCIGGTCSHICVISPNITTRFRCVCPVGMQISKIDNRTCLERSDYPRVVMMSETEVLTIPLHSVGNSVVERMTLPSPGMVDQITALVYNPVNHSLVMQDRNANLFEFNLDEKSLRTIEKENLQDMHMQRMDIDLIGQNLYWIDSRNKSLKATSIRNGVTTIVKEGIWNVSTFSVAQETRSVLLTMTRGSATLLYRVSLDGTSSTMVKHISMNESVGPLLSIDGTTQTIYYLNGNKDKIMSSSFAEKISIAAYGMSGVPKNIISAHDQIYFVPNYWEVRVGPKLKYKMSNEYVMWGVITLLNRTVSSDVWNLLQNHECSVKSVRYKRCSHICIVSNSGEFLGDCRCPEGFALGEDGRNCVQLPVCDTSQFICHDSKCIDKNLTCDGIPDCSSEEDENDENCKDKLQCPINMFHCGKENEPGQCIPAAWQCDGKVQCEDHSDEKCTKFSCSENQLYCESKDSCIEKSWICARKYSCAGMDFNKVCEGFPCGSDHFMCANTQRCVATHWFCDGANDCQDMSDEPQYCQEYKSRG